MKPLQSGEGLQVSVVLLTVLVLFVFSIATGYVLFSGVLGWGDAVSFLQLSSIPKFIHSWWHEANGRMAQPMLVSALLMPFRWLSPTPDQYPWWLVRGFALFSLLSAPLLMLAFLPGSILPRRKFYLILLLLTFWIVWSLNPVTYEISAWFTAAEFVGYSGPIFLISAAILLLSRKLIPSISNNHALSLGLVMIGGFVFSLMGEQYLLVFPMFAIGIALSGVARGEIKVNSVVRVGLLCAIGVAVGWTIYWMAPGQHLRSESLHLRMGNVWEVYAKSIYLGYDFLSQHFVYSNKPPHSLKILFLIIHTSFLLLAMIWAWQDFKRKPTFPREIRGTGVLLLTMLVAYEACFSTLMVSDYFPNEAFELPALLLAVAYVTAALILLRMLALRSSGSEWIRSTGYVAGVVVTGAVLYLGHHDYVQNKDTNEQVSRHDHMQRLVHEKIWQEATHSAERKFVLVNCPVATPKFGWTMDSPWGMKAYFNWRGMPSIKVFLRGNYDFPKNWNDGSYKIIDCDELLPFQQKSQGSSLSNSGHIVSDRSWLVATAPSAGWNSNRAVSGPAWKRASSRGRYGSVLMKLGKLKTSALWLRHNPLQDATRDAYYRKVITLAKPTIGTLTISGINRYQLYINGKLLGTGNSWVSPGQYRVRLRDGDVIAVHVNADQPGTDGLLIDFRAGR